VGKLIAGRVLYGIVCLAAAVLLVVAGYAHQVVGLATELGKGIAISNSPSVGAMNILVMGLESRTDFQGQTLPESLLTAMHAGNASAVSAGQVGSQDTNTLILIHVFAGGQRAVGFSIPRDDLVTYPQAYDGQREGKIDGAYAYAYYQYVSANVGKEDKSNLYLNANRAGQQAAVDTVQAVTGQHIDHFVEANLAGFYYLAAAFGGIEVCVKPAPAQGGFPAGANLTDIDTLVSPPTDNSGFSAYKDGYNRKTGGPQYLHLSAAQSLAFVRSRDTLPGVDLGRTKRQQATLDYVIYELRHEGALTGFGKLESLLNTANQYHYLVTDSTFNLLDFATDMRALSGSNLSFATLPYTPENNVQVPGYPGTQDVNIINVPAIRQMVKTAFTGGSPGRAASPPTGSQATGARPVSAPPADTPSASPSGSGSPPASPSADAGAGASGTGGPVAVSPSAKYGIPCVY
jgi:LCP family protein required for cell wall assembly